MAGSPARAIAQWRAGDAMSVSLAIAVYNSALQCHLKATLAPVALIYGDDHGYRIYPSVDRWAWLASKTPRQLSSDLSVLCAMGVLVPRAGRAGGRKRTSEYWLNVDALPKRPVWTAKPRSGLHGFDRRTERAKPRIATHETVNFEPETTKSQAQNHEVYFMGSVQIDQSEQIERERSGSTAAPPRAPRFGGLAKEPNGDNYHVIVRIAREILKTAPAGMFTSAVDGEFRDALKVKCGELKIAYQHLPPAALVVACRDAWKLESIARQVHEPLPE